MNLRHLQLSMSNPLTLDQGGEPYLLPLDIVNSSYGTGTTTFYYDKNTFTVIVPKSPGTYKNFYVSGDVMVSRGTVTYDNTDGVEVAVRLKDAQSAPPYTAHSMQEYINMYIPTACEDTATNDLELRPSYSISVDTTISVLPQSGGVIYFLAAALKQNFDDGDVFTIDSAKLSIIQIV